MLVVCNERIHKNSGENKKTWYRNAIHHSLGNILRKMSWNDEALEHLRLVQYNNRQEAYYRSLEMICQILAYQAIYKVLDDLEEKREKMEQSVQQARSVHALIMDRTDEFLHQFAYEAQLLLAKMLWNQTQLGFCGLDHQEKEARYKEIHDLA